MVLQEPENGVRPVLPARDGRIAGPALRLHDRHLHLRLGEFQPVGAVFLGPRDLLARQLSGGDGIHALDAVRHVAIGDALHLENMQAAELRDLLEAEGGVIDEPDGRRLGHERSAVHGY
jgi:hypothetical protein